MSDSRFPPEIEQKIFTYALKINSKQPNNLLLVARRVREWLLPIVWEVVVYQDPRLYEIPLDSILPLRQYGTHIQHLLLSVDYKYIEPSNPDDYQIHPHQIFDSSLLLCPNITNLALWWLEPPVSLQPLVNLSQLTHLSMDVNRILELIRDERDIDSSGQTESRTWYSTVQAGDARPALFPNITHFDTRTAEWLGSRCHDNIPTLAIHFPKLTHLAHPRTQWTTANTVVIRLSLKQFGGLEVLVWWKAMKKGEGSGVEEDLKEKPRVEDERLVLVLMSGNEEDWEREARGGGMGIWKLGDSVVEGRRKAKRVGN
ncbi:hypothetical protein BDN72DRAFT_900911 [Pluteus cervinus]|uniref:Uncharacterized protein n=1 Tax=Pluteus cervinus TaxID=181527 RepID=A0ACD3AK03_9AGAR|nr:hypothetical protein BDN72DRAFT_900911 [Pluteus cervinus]